MLRIVAQTGHSLLQEVPRVTPDPRDFQSVNLKFGADCVERGDVGAFKVLDEPVGEEVAEEGVDLALGKTGDDDERIGKRSHKRPEK